MMKSFMHKGIRVMLIILISFIACLLILICVLLAYSPGKLEPFLSADGTLLANSVSEKRCATIGGVAQGMFIRGENIQNPVILFLHGGPGMPEYFLAEKYLTALEACLPFAIGSSAAGEFPIARIYRRRASRRNNLYPTR